MIDFSLIFDLFFFFPRGVLASARVKQFCDLNSLFSDCLANGDSFLHSSTMFVNLTMTEAQYEAQIVSLFGATLAPQILSLYAASLYDSPGQAAAALENHYFFTCAYSA